MKRKLVFVSGQGFDHSSEDGKFEVRIDGKFRRFDKLSEAIAFYNSIEERKAIWDVTDIPELLESHNWVKN